MSDRDYYEVMGLTPTADAALVDQAYWHLARKYQSLSATNARACFMLDDLNEAYGVLGTPRLRAQYDAFRNDVLIRKGMIKPVSSKRKKRAKRSETPADGARQRSLSLPGVKHWRTYAAGGAISAVGVGAGWLGISPVFVMAALAGGVGLAVSPALRRQMPDVSLSLPSLPSMSMPEIHAPRLDVPKLPELSVPNFHDAATGIDAKGDPMDADELRESTAAMISRWRNSVGLRPAAPAQPAQPAQPSEEQPSTTLVEIVEDERDIDEESEPLTAVIDILRGSRRTAGTR